MDIPQLAFIWGIFFYLYYVICRLKVLFSKLRDDAVASKCIRMEHMFSLSCFLKKRSIFTGIALDKHPEYQPEYLRSWIEVKVACILF